MNYTTILGSVIAAISQNNCYGSKQVLFCKKKKVPKQVKFVCKCGNVFKVKESDVAYPKLCKNCGETVRYKRGNNK